MMHYKDFGLGEGKLPARNRVPVLYEDPKNPEILAAQSELLPPFKLETMMASN